MESAKYETIDRKFLDTFYRECGREVTLAYTVLNQTNTWAITFFALVMSPSLVGLVNRTEGALTFDYPNVFYWMYLIVSWGLLLRFFQRSALALSNMYRWNELASATWEAAALPGDHPRQSKLNDTLVEKVDRLMMRWQSPRPAWDIAWGTLKLMYLAPLIVFLSMIIWGVAVLPRDDKYWVAVIVFIVWTLTETFFFVGWNSRGGKALRGNGAEPFLFSFQKRPACDQAQSPPTKLPGDAKETTPV